MDKGRGALNHPPGLLDKPWGVLENPTGMLTAEGTNLVVDEAEEFAGPSGARVSLLAHPHLPVHGVDDYFQIDMLAAWFKSINLGAERSPGPPNRLGRFPVHTLPRLVKRYGSQGPT